MPQQDALNASQTMRALRPAAPFFLLLLACYAVPVSSNMDVSVSSGQWPACVGVTGAEVGECTALNSTGSQYFEVTLASCPNPCNCEKGTATATRLFGDCSGWLANATTAELDWVAASTPSQGCSSDHDYVVSASPQLKGCRVRMSFESAKENASVSFVYNAASSEVTNYLGDITCDGLSDIHLRDVIKCTGIAANRAGDEVLLTFISLSGPTQRQVVFVTQDSLGLPVLNQSWSPSVHPYLITFFVQVPATPTDVLGVAYHLRSTDGDAATQHHRIYEGEVPPPRLQPSDDSIIECNLTTSCVISTMDAGGVVMADVGDYDITISSPHCSEDAFDVAVDVETASSFSVAVSHRSGGPCQFVDTSVVLNVTVGGWPILHKLQNGTISHTTVLMSLPADATEAPPPTPAPTRTPSPRLPTPAPESNGNEVSIILGFAAAALLLLALYCLAACYSRHKAKRDAFIGTWCVIGDSEGQDRVGPSYVTPFIEEGPTDEFRSPNPNSNPNANHSLSDPGVRGIDGASPDDEQMQDLTSDEHGLAATDPTSDPADVVGMGLNATPPDSDSRAVAQRHPTYRPWGGRSQCLSCPG